MDYSIYEIANILDRTDSVTRDSNISMLLTDSRKVFFPEECLFFAIATSNNDGHKYVSELIKKGVRNFVVEKFLPEWESHKKINFIQVKNSVDALQKVAKHHRSKFDIPVIGITGSNGKTIVKEWLYQILEDKFRITHSPRSYNSQIGVPLSLWQLNKDTELGIFEAGISQPEEMSKLETMIRPTIGVLTNIGQAHQEGFESMKQKCLEKLDLFIHCDAIICEEENELIEECMEIACISQKRITWSRKGSSKSPLYIRKIKKEKDSTTIEYMVLGLSSEFSIPFTDDASIENAIHVLATSLVLHFGVKEFAEKAKSLSPVAMRMDVREARSNCTLINDSYNTDVNSLAIALDFFKQQATDKNKEKILILSDIPQSGMTLESLYTKASSLVVTKGVDTLIAVGREIKKHKKLFSQIESYFFDTTDDLLNSKLWQNGFENKLILLKGARAFEFERLSKGLEIQKHETVLEISLDAIVHNFNFYKSKLKPTTKIICMAKANGYGTGAAEIARSLQYHKCDYIAVAVAEEGISLRKAGITIPIIVLNSEVDGFEELVEHSLEPEVYSFKILKTFLRESKALGVTNYPIHLKLDTGMHRLGFEMKDLEGVLDILVNNNGLRIQSVFSHLAASEDKNEDDFTKGQIKLFKQMVAKLEESLSYPIVKHILNSAGIERFTKEQMDMVRLGISLYGVSSGGVNGLKNVCTLRTTVLQIKQLTAGDTVGYNRKGVINQISKIATIRIGYADGISRQFGNGKASVLINGHRAPFIGNICMDLSMIDVTGLDVKEGDQVVIFGDQLPLNEVAKQIGAIPYEILTSISQRVKHIYFKE